ATALSGMLGPSRSVSAAGARGAAAAGSSRSGAACSTVGASAASWLARSRSACRWAASVALKSSASGPSRMLARRRAIEHLLREIAVHARGLTGWVVLQHRHPLHRRLSVPNGLANPCVQDEVAEVLGEDVDSFLRVQQA